MEAQCPELNMVTEFGKLVGVCFLSDSRNKKWA